MPKRRMPWQLVPLAVLVLLVIGLLGLHLIYPLPYIFKVSVYQDPDYDDIHRFPAREIAASESPRRLPAALSSRVAQVLELHPDIENLETFLEETETTAFLTVHHGQLVMERYLRGHDQTTVQNTFSVAKSVTSALVGLAARDGLLDYEASIIRYLPELGERDPRFADITVEHLLDMRSGIRFSEEISFPFVTADNALIYYHPDLASVVLEKTTIAANPGVFLYNNYNPPLIGLILRRVTGLAVGEYLERELWQPMGAAYPAGWTIDDRGFERMESGFHACARDLALFGQLYLDHGMAGEQGILPEAWVAATTEEREHSILDRYNGRAWDYRAGWWIVPRAEGPSDFCAIGHFGQFIYVSPQYQVVFVRNGPGRGEWGDFDWTALFYSAAEKL